MIASVLPSPAPQESLDGFLKRLSEVEFWPDVSDFLGSFGLCYGRQLIENAEKVEDTLGLPTGTLKSIAPTAEPSEPAKSWRFERHHSAPVCPECISSGKPHHQSWRHSLVTCCVDHALRLIDQCPMCEQVFLPGRGSYDSCHCGCPLDRLEHIEVGDAEKAVSALIAGQMHPARSCLPPSMAFRTPSDIGEFIYFLASGQVETATGKQGKTPFPRDVDETLSFLVGATDLLCQWPKRFRDEVSQRLQVADPTLSSAPARLGRWYQRLIAFDGQAYNDFRAALGEVVQREFDGAYVGGADAPSELRNWISAAEAAKLLHIRAERLVDAIAKQHLPGKQYLSGFGHSHTMIHRETITEVAQNRQRFIDKTAARNLLGISRKQYDLFTNSGIFARFVPENLPPLVDGQHDAVELKRFVDDIASNSTALEGQTVALQELNLRFTTDTSGLTKVYCRIADGCLRPASSSTKGCFAEFQFSSAEVDAILSEVRRGPGLTVQQVSELTGWKSQCIAAWCKQGLLSHETFEHAGRVGRIIRLEDLISFQATFVPAAALAKQTKTSSRFLMTRYKEAGIELVGAFQEGKAWRGHLVPIADLSKGVISEPAKSNGKG